MGGNQESVIRSKGEAEGIVELVAVKNSSLANFKHVPYLNAFAFFVIEGEEG